MAAPPAKRSGGVASKRSGAAAPTAKAAERIPSKQQRAARQQRERALRVSAFVPGTTEEQLGRQMARLYSIAREALKADIPALGSWHRDASIRSQAVFNVSCIADRLSAQDLDGARIQAAYACGYLMALVDGRSAFRDGGAAGRRKIGDATRQTVVRMAQSYRGSGISKVAAAEKIELELERIGIERSAERVARDLQEEFPGTAWTDASADASLLRR